MMHAQTQQLLTPSTLLLTTQQSPIFPNSSACRSCGEPWSMPLLQKPTYEEKQKETSIYNRPQLYLSPVKGAIHINGVKVITARALACLRVLNTLMLHRWHDCRAGLSPEDYTYLNIFKIADALEKEGVSIADTESLRRILNRAIQCICMRLSQELGIIIEGKDIIEMKGWRGFNQKEEFGYRLNPLTLFLKI